LSALAFLSADEILGAFNELKVHLPEEASEGYCCLATSIAPPICNLCMSACGICVCTNKTTYKHGTTDGEI
jgi:hypothetical protein